MFKKQAAVFYQGLKTRGVAEFFEQLQKHSTKSVSLWAQNNGSNCER